MFLATYSIYVVVCIYIVLPSAVRGKVTWSLFDSGDGPEPLGTPPNPSVSDSFPFRYGSALTLRSSGSYSQHSSRWPNNN